jgi:serine protease Do
MLSVLPGVVAAEPDAEAFRNRRRTPVVEAVERVTPATVNITSSQQVHRRVNPFGQANPFFEEFFGRFRDPRPRTMQSLGTGVIIGPEHHVLTNEHVLAGATDIRVTLQDGREYKGELIGADPETDLAVVAIDTDEDLPSAPLGDSDDLMIGETVIAIGNPFGLGHTVTTGVLSATNRSLRTGESEYHGFLQTDASINPGNSGGPLVNLNGEVIGINTAIFQEAEGIGFAIPIDRAQAIASELIQHGELLPVWLGVRLQELTPRLREALGVQSKSGALVAHVFEGSPAGPLLVRGDVIVELEGTRIQSPRNYFEILRGITEDDPAHVRVERDGELLEHQIQPASFPQERADELAEILIGISVEEARQNSGGGMLVEGVVAQSPAARVGIRPGDRIVRVDRDTVTDRETFRRAVTKLRGRRQVLLLVQRGRRGYHVTLGIS